MSFLKDISKIGYEAARGASKIGSMSNDAANILNGNFDKVAKKHMKKAAFKNTNKALNKGLRMFGL